MQKLRERLKDQKGFTLVEMLIVVAIIAILIAVSIPMVNSSLEKTRHAVDRANIRDAIGLGNIYYLTENPTAEVTMYYGVNAATHQGKLVSSKTDTDYPAVTGECKGSGSDECSTLGSNGKNIEVTIKADGTVTAEWVS